MTKTRRRNGLKADYGDASKGVGWRGSRSARGVEGRVLRGGTFVNRVRSGRKQP